MKKIFILITGFFIVVHVDAQTSGDPLLGRWINEEKTSIIEFVKTGDTYEAIVREGKDPDYVGTRLITHLKPYGASDYKEGKLHYKKMEINCTAKLMQGKMLEVYLTYGLLSRTLKWNKQ